MKVYNTLSGQKEEFSPQSDEVKMYVCGVTPYSDAHIGHAMSYIIFDVIRRYLQYRGYKVKYVQNITDIDDKIIERANRLGVSTHELAKKYSDSFFEDMAALNIRKPDKTPYATEEIPKMIEVVQGLINKRYAYASQGSVYFRVRKVRDYGKLSHRSLESMMSAEGALGSEEKESPMDFVLWKTAKPGEPSWESPWGKGRPGWHIECSAMSLKYLGNTIDIHGGGQDLVFPHHENEIAQSESFTGIKPFVKYWLHNGLVQLGQEKMSKSLGNLVTIKEALEKYNADALRIFVLGSHYRSPLTYSEETLEAAERGAERLRQVVLSEAKGEKTDRQIDIESYRNKFIKAMDDDFNTAQSFATVFDLARDINRFGDEGYNIEEAKRAFSELASVLGLTLKPPEAQTFEAEIYKKSLTLKEHAVENFREAIKPIEDSLPQLDKSQAVRSGLLKSLENRLKGTESPSFITLETETNLHKEALESLHNKLKYSTPQNYGGIVDDLRSLDASASASTASCINIREQLREAKQFQLADEIRVKLDELGIALDDTSQGTVWKRK